MNSRYHVQSVGRVHVSKTWNGPTTSNTTCTHFLLARCVHQNNLQAEDPRVYPLQPGHILMVRQSSSNVSTHCPVLLESPVSKKRRFFDEIPKSSREYSSQARRQDVAAGGAKNQKEGGRFLKYSIACMQQPVGQTWNGGALISNGGAGRNCPLPLATALTVRFPRRIHVLSLWVKWWSNFQSQAHSKIAVYTWLSESCLRDSRETSQMVFLAKVWTRSTVTWATIDIQWI